MTNGWNKFRSKFGGHDYTIEELSAMYGALQKHRAEIAMHPPEPEIKSEEKPEHELADFMDHRPDDMDDGIPPDEDFAEDIDDEYIEFTTEISIFNGLSRTIKLTKEESEEIDRLFENIILIRSWNH